MHSHTAILSLSTLATLFLSASALPTNAEAEAKIDLIARAPTSGSWALDCGGDSNLTSFCDRKDSTWCDADGHRHIADLMDSRCTPCNCKAPPSPVQQKSSTTADAPAAYKTLITQLQCSSDVRSYCLSAAVGAYCPDPGSPAHQAVMFRGTDSEGKCGSSDPPPIKPQGAPIPASLRPRYVEDYPGEIRPGVYRDDSVVPEDPAPKPHGEPIPDSLLHGVHPRAVEDVPELGPNDPAYPKPEPEKGSGGCSCVNIFGAA